MTEETKMQIVKSMSYGMGENQIAEMHDYLTVKDVRKVHKEMAAEIAAEVEYRKMMEG